MSFSHFPWKNRVFRIDRECYLLFLGIDELDDKPFIRIGNSSWLDERVLDVISHTVITESFTGNPFGEVGLTHHYHGRYLGEPRIVEVIKSFFDRFHVSDPDIVSYREQEEREGRDHVYFYNTGNIVVSFGGQRLFDLYAREKADRHYNYYCSEILTIFRKNPLKWDGGSLKGKGLFRIGENLFFFDGSRLLGLKWDRNYFKTLAGSGWDPDKMEGILVSLKPEEMEGDKSAGVMNFIKRGIAARNSMTFFSRDESFSGKIEPLFEYVRSRDVPIKFQDISAGGQFEWNGTKGEWNDGNFTFALEKDIAASLSSSGDAEIRFGEKKADCHLPDRVPAVIHPEEPDLDKLKSLYIDSVAQALLKFEPAGKQATFVRTSLPVMQALSDGVGQEDFILTLPQSKAVADFKRLIRSLGQKEESSLILYASNCASFLEIIAAAGGFISGEAREIADLLQKRASRPAEQAGDFLYSAHYYRNGCFYLPYKLDISPGDRAKAAEMHEALIQCDKREVDFFFSERKRLEAILASLSEGTLWDEMRQAEKLEGEAPRTETAASSSAPSPGRGSFSVTQGQTSVGGEGTNRPGGSSGGRERRRLWPLLLLVLLFLGGGLFFGYSRISGGGASPPGISRSDSSSSTVTTADPGSDNTAGETASPEGNTSLAGGNGSTGQAQASGSTDDGSMETPGAGNAGSGGTDGGAAGESVPDASPLSEKDSQIIPPANKDDLPQVVIKDTEQTIVRKPFVPSETFLENFIVGGIQITMADIHLKANAIAVMNGYRDLGFHVVDGKDPTIIEPGLVLKIPGNLSYEVVKDDNIWYIAARLLESELIQYTDSFEKLKSAYDKETKSGGSGEGAVKEMENLVDNSNCENFRKKVHDWLNSR
ncbi:MAG: hypothetical protein JXA95_01330 [Spirochaetales bacterium]|nr:hypothetical protein [Spirochaetales bacterium]